MKKLSIIIPVYNEEKTLLEVLRRVESVDLSFEKEIIIVDDFSTDGTREILKKLDANKYRIILKEKNGGKGSALKEGFLAATGDIAIIQDADLEYDPKDYKQILTPILEGNADVVYGSRFKGGYKPTKGLFSSYFANRFLTFLSNLLTGLKLTDMETCYKAFRKEAVDSFKFNLKSGRFGIEPELTACVARNNWRIKEVGIFYQGRKEKEGKKINWKDGLAAIWHIVRFNALNQRIMEFACLFSVVVFVLFFSLSNLTTKPGLWFDEGQTIEISHNFLLFGNLDILTSPGVFSGLRFLVGSNGYPLTIPLAGFFSVFGFGLEQARVFMIFWVIAALFSVYFITKAIFGRFPAAASVLLTASFASFYDNGLSVIGELPGFLFLAWGLYFLVQKRGYFLTGFFFGLAAAVKPSMCLILLPSFFLFLLFFERERFFKKIFRFILGAAPALIVWVFFVFPNPFLLSTWKMMSVFYANTTDTPVSQLLLKNLPLVFTHSTFIYFETLFAVIIYAFLKSNIAISEKRKFIGFIFVYGVFVFAYFAKSSGAIRYLLALELLSFMILPVSITALVKKRGLAMLIIAGLVIFQFFHLFCYSDMHESSVFQDVAGFINSKDDSSVGIFDLPQVVALVPFNNRYHVMKTMITPQIGENPLSFPRKFLPDLIVFGEGSRGEKSFINPYRSVLETNYVLIKKIGSYLIYERS